MKRERLIERTAQKTIKILNKTNCNKVILSKNLKNEKQYINYLCSKNLNVVDGKFLFSILAPEALEYILQKLNINKENIRIAILVNDLNEVSIRKYKRNS